jgi:hypothetical protein
LRVSPLDPPRGITDTCRWPSTADTRCSYNSEEDDGEEEKCSISTGAVPHLNGPLAWSERWGPLQWFNSFPTGSEASIERRAAWILEADADGDGRVSTEDLVALDATEVFTTQLGYSLDGAPDGITIDNALDFVRAQLATQGHFKGEGECIWQFDGATGN